MLDLDRHDHEAERRQHHGPAPEIEMSALDRGHELGIGKSDRQRAQQFRTALGRQRKQRGDRKEEGADTSQFEREPAGDVTGGHGKGDQQRRNACKPGDVARRESREQRFH